MAIRAVTPPPPGKPHTPPGLGEQPVLDEPPTPPLLRGDGQGLEETPRPIHDFLPWAGGFEVYDAVDALHAEADVDAALLAKWRRWGWLAACPCAWRRRASP